MLQGSNAIAPPPQSLPAADLNVNVRALPGVVPVSEDIPAGLKPINNAALIQVGTMFW